MGIIATRTGMKDLSVEELKTIVEVTDRKKAAAPAFIRRTSYARWASNRSAIVREIDRREGEVK